MKALLKRLGLFCILAGGASPLMAQESVETFYKGRSLDLNIGFSVGGTYDLYARLLARHMGDHVPGKPRIIPKQMVGAGTLRAANFMYTVAPQDGTHLATIDQAVPLQQVLGDPGIMFDSKRFIWIGNPIADNNTMAAWHTSGIASVEDAKRISAVVGANGITASAQYPQAMNVLLGTRFKIVTGYAGGTEVNLAMERGEVGLRGQNSWSSWKANHPGWLKEQKIKIIVQIGLKKHPELPDVPLLMDLATNEQDRAILELLSSPTAIGRPIFTTPDVPSDRVAALRRAFDNMIVDPFFLADAQKMNLDITPVGGVELQKIVETMTNASPEIAGRLRDVLAPLTK